MNTKQIEHLLVTLGRLAAEADLKACESHYTEAQKQTLTNCAKIFRLAQEELLSC